MLKNLISQAAFAAVVLLCIGMVRPVLANNLNGPLPVSLQGVPVPTVPGLLDGDSPIIINKTTAVALGKALFWDTTVGSDGYACASCHFHAGADTRTKNQLSPGGKFSTLPTAGTFQTTAGGNQGGPNYTMTSADFPFFQLADPLNGDSGVIFKSDDVLGSEGTFAGQFKTVVAGGANTNDVCARAADPTFHVGAIGTRKVTPRNAPTVINSIFNYRSFWDGRANNVFNGSSNWGDRDTNAGIWVKQTGSKAGVVKQRLELINASIASLATAPPLNDQEMSCDNRVWPDIGRKLLLRQPLQNQQVHHQDSVLGSFSLSSTSNLKNGLNTSYRNLITQAFNSKYWAYSGLGPFGSPANGGAPFNQMEANFSMFFGLSIQMYISTLVSDQSPFDQSPVDANGMPTALSASALNGLNQFIDANCSQCHVGPTFTAATVATNGLLAQTQPAAFGLNSNNPVFTSSSVVNRLATQSGNTLMDTGFANNGVSPDGADLGLGAVDDFGYPLSFSLQYLQYLAGNTSAVYDATVSTISPCNFQLALALNVAWKSTEMFTQADGVMPQAESTTGCIETTQAYQPTPAAMKAQLANPTSLKTMTITGGLFKIPSLRNIELTGPYMHNGSMSTLPQVLDFYARGGNFQTTGKGLVVIPNGTLSQVPQNMADIITFLETLTDNRVRYEQAPFDHPAITITNGHAGNNQIITQTNPLSPELGADQSVVINAVGAGGNTAPLLRFDQLLSP